MPNEKEMPQNSNSLSVSSGEANNKLLDILSEFPSIQEALRKKERDPK